MMEMAGAGRDDPPGDANKKPPAILFYLARGEHGYLSNFARTPIELDGWRWATVEHYYQAQKFTDPEHVAIIRGTSSPARAARIGRSRPDLVRADWSELKQSVMLRALRAKFSQHPVLAELLLKTGDAELIEHTDLDSYWADGGNGTGLNRLGALLMRVREELRSSAS